MNAWIVSTLAFLFGAGLPTAQGQPASSQLVTSLSQWLDSGNASPPSDIRTASPDDILRALPAAMPWNRWPTQPAKGKVELEHTYYLYQLPDGYTPQKAWPMILSFHGTPRRHCERCHNIYWKGDPARAGYILVSPNLDHGEWHKYGDPPVQDVLRDVYTRFHIDQNRVFVDGYSSGGTASWVFGTRLADLLAGSVVRCGVRRVPDAQVGNLAGRGVYLLHATDDVKVKVFHSRRVVPVMKRLGVHYIYVEHPGKHDFFPKENPKVLAYFDKLVRPRPDNFAYFGPFFGLDRIVYFFHLRGSTHQVKGGFGKNEVWLDISDEKKIKNLEVFLSREMVDFNKPIKLRINKHEYTLSVKPSTSAFLGAWSLSPLFEPDAPDRTFIAGVKVIESGKYLSQPDQL